MPKREGISNTSSRSGERDGWAGSGWKGITELVSSRASTSHLDRPVGLPPLALTSPRNSCDESSDAIDQNGHEACEAMQSKQASFEKRGSESPHEDRTGKDAARLLRTRGGESGGDA